MPGTTIDATTIGDAVRRGRLARRLDQRDLARDLGVSAVTLRRLEAGEGGSLALTLAALDRLGVELVLTVPDATGRRVSSPTRARVVLERPEERVQLELHRAVARRLRVDPDPVLRRARVNLDALRRNVSGPRAHEWVNDWALALDGPVPALIDLCVRQDEYGIDMRQVSPFAGVLTPEERLAAIRAGRRLG